MQKAGEKSGQSEMTIHELAGEKSGQCRMTIHEFGMENTQIIVLIHPSLVKWDYFEYVIPLLEKRYHLIIPALPGYDFEQDSDFTSVEQIAAELGSWLADRGFRKVFACYGCSMGGSIAVRMAVDGVVEMEYVIMDGGITPYQLPWLVTRLIALRDFAMMAVGKLGGIKLLEKAFNTDEYSRENMNYVAEVLKHCSYGTLWRTFDSCNNYVMPEEPPVISCKLQYWYAESEEKARAWDIKYMRRMFPETKFVKIPELGHGGLVLLKPELFAEMLGELI